MDVCLQKQYKNMPWKANPEPSLGQWLPLGKKEGEKSGEGVQ